MGTRAETRGAGWQFRRAWRDGPVAVSIIIPAYNEEERLRSSLPRLCDHLRSERGVEIIVVDDGSVDRTSEVAATHLAAMPLARLVRLPWNGGKGAAVKAGVSVASGDVIVFMDADLATDPKDLPRLVDALADADVALGSRGVEGSKVSGGTLGRKVSSRVFSRFTQGLLGVDVVDTQCGFKAFRASTAKLLFHLGEVNGFAFDVEMVALARLLGYRVVEVPIRWTAVEGSSVRPLRDPLSMVRDVLRTRLRRDRMAGRARALAPQHFLEGMVDQYHWAASERAEALALVPVVVDSGATDEDVTIDLTDNVVIDLTSLDVTALDLAARDRSSG